MKATLEFSLPEEHNEHLIAVNAQELYGTMFELAEQIRGYLKHGHVFKSADEAMEWVRGELWATLSKIDS